MANQNQNVFKEIIALAFDYPKSFFKQLNRENWNTLKRALMNESPKEIISNARILLQKTNSDSINIVRGKIQRFVDSIPDTTAIANICVTHEASRTGAPLIILNIAKFLKEDYDILPIQLLCEGGEMEDEFRAIGPTYTIHFYHNKPLLKQEMKLLMTALAEKCTVQRAFVNSEGSTRLLQYLSKHSVKNIVSLIHEMGHYYPQNAWSHINKYSNTVVFPAEFVKQKAIENNSFKESKIVVSGQGLMKPEILAYDKADGKRKLIEYLQVDPSSKIVLGCGSPIARKGIDLYVTTAISILNQCQADGTPMPYFIWLGTAANSEFQIWLERDIEASGYRDHIRLLGGFKDVSMFFSGSDLFYLTSRGDPFPCVVHEALAAKLPVIGFRDTGGAVEILNNKIGRVIPFGDIAQAATTIKTALANIDQEFDIDHDDLADYFSFDRYVKELNEL